MSALYVFGAFVLGMLFQLWLGSKLVRWGLSGKYKDEVLKGFPIEALIELEQKTRREIARRKELLR